MSAGHQRLERARPRAWSAPTRKRLAHVRDVEQAGARRASAGARRGCPSGTAPASRSRRTAPCGRRARRAARRSGVVSGAVRRRGRISSAAARSDRPFGSPVRTAHPDAIAPVRAPSVQDLRDFPAPPESVGYPRRWAHARERAPLSRVSSPPRSFWPERFRGGCAFGAGDQGLSAPAGFFRGDQKHHCGR